MDEQTRWRGRPLLAAGIRIVAYLVPILCSVLAGAFISRTLPAASSFAAAVAWWFTVLATSAIVVIAVEHVARRLLPLSALLGLSLAFPDQAPSRFGVAIRAGSTRRLEERIVAARDGRSDGEPMATATILELATLLNTHDRRTRGHSERVRVFADLLGEELRLPPEDRDRLRWAALLHDIGKLSVPAEILNKPGKPDAAEWAVLQRHPDESEHFLAPLRSWLGPWTLAASQHHERWDGAGYPKAIAGNDISLAARIVCVADSYEVMTATRAYKRPMSAVAARAELTRCSGAQFDPVVVRAFLQISVGRLRVGAGPVAWLAQIPFLGQLPRLATGGATLPNLALAAQTSVASTALAVGATAGIGIALPVPAAATPTVAEATTAPAPVVRSGNEVHGAVEVTTRAGGPPTTIIAAQPDADTPAEVDTAAPTPTSSTDDEGDEPAGEDGGSSRSSADGPANPNAGGANPNADPNAGANPNAGGGNPNAGADPNAEGPNPNADPNAGANPNAGGGNPNADPSADADPSAGANPNAGGGNPNADPNAGANPNAGGGNPNADPNAGADPDAGDVNGNSGNSGSGNSGSGSGNSGSGNSGSGNSGSGNSGSGNSGGGNAHGHDDD